MSARKQLAKIGQDWLQLVLFLKLQLSLNVFFLFRIHDFLCRYKFMLFAIEITIIAVSIEIIMACSNYPSEQMFADLLAIPQTSHIARHVKVVIANMRYYVCQIAQNNSCQLGGMQKQIIQQLECIADTQQMEEGCLGLGDPSIDDKLTQLSSQPQRGTNDEKMNKVIAGVNSFGEVVVHLYEGLFESSPLYSYNADHFHHQKVQKIIRALCSEMIIILKQSEHTVERLMNYNCYESNLKNKAGIKDSEPVKMVQQLRSTGEICPIEQQFVGPQGCKQLGSQTSCFQQIYDSHDRSSKRHLNHFARQKISIEANLTPQVFKWIEPQIHRAYLSAVSSAYHEIVPFKIKYVISPSTLELESKEMPQISAKNYFKEDVLHQKMMLYHLKPGTKTMFYYYLADISKLLSVTKEYIREQTLPTSWLFGEYVRSLSTPQGSIYAISCRTTKDKLDPSLYEIDVSQTKVSNRGPIPSPMRDSAFVYCNKFLYVVGGCNDKQKCSTRGFKYSIRDKKWMEIAEANIGLRKPTVCTFKDRYIIKLGGLNQFNFINKSMEIYDSLTDRWSIIHVSMSNPMEEVSILEDSLAVQINEAQLYVFGGRNSNNYSADTGMLVEITEIREKIKAPAKVTVDVWSANIEKRNLLSFWGMQSNANVIVHNGCLYVMRADTSQIIPVLA